MAGRCVLQDLTHARIVHWGIFVPTQADTSGVKDLNFMNQTPRRWTILTMDLINKHCTPCEGTVKPFTKRKAMEYLKMTRDWELVPGKPMQIRRKFAFKDFQEALKFVNKVGRLAQSENHHPDILLHNYRRVTVTLTTHSIKGLSENDFILASKINQL